MRWLLLPFVFLIACADPTGDAKERGAGGDGSGATAPKGGNGGTGGNGGSSANGGASGGGGDAGAGYQPGPIPDVPDEVPALCANPSPPDYFQFLDDACGDKVWPSDTNRDLACPILDDGPLIPLTGGGEALYRPSSDPIVIEDVLGDIVPSGMFVTVILVRRVNGVPHYRYLSNGTAFTAYQPWSTTKFLAAANAAAALRIASSYTVGLTASVSGHRLGDLVTSVHNYDYAPFSSNGLGRYFHDVGGRDRANSMMHGDWLGRPTDETFGGNYGAPAPSLGYTFTEPGSGPTITITPDGSSGPANHLSSFTTAEALKRLVLHREEASQRLPGIQWADVKTLLYGAENSTKYGPWGGMTADTAIYLQTGHDIGYIEARSQGQWRIFSKLGLGTQGQFLDVGYGCFPVLDPNGAPVAGWGRELVVAAHLPTGGSSWAERDRLLAESYRAIVKRVIEGRL
jgi:hypothetical protein